MTITEKLDGTNSSIFIYDPMEDDGNQEYYTTAKDALGKLWNIRAGSRNRWINPSNDNYGFASWVWATAAELVGLGEGHHFGEWWGKGIQRNYGLKEKRFSLFNTHRWTEHSKPTCVIPNSNPNAEQKSTEHPPSCCHVVPVLFNGSFSTEVAKNSMRKLEIEGSIAAKGFMNPEGIIVHHDTSNQYFKALIDNDSKPKSKQH